MAFNAIRLRNIVRKIYVLSSVENNLAKTRATVRAILNNKRFERKRLDRQVDNNEISGQEWALKTDALDILIDEIGDVVQELEIKIADAESERMRLQTELNNYEDDDITRAIEATGLWN